MALPVPPLLVFLLAGWLSPRWCGALWSREGERKSTAHALVPGGWRAGPSGREEESGYSAYRPRAYEWILLVVVYQPRWVAVPIRELGRPAVY